MEPSTRDLAAAARDEGVRRRYQAKIRTFDESECWWWTGAIAGNAHGRIWLAEGWTVIAHRLGWATTHPGEEVPPPVGRARDNPPCPRPAHWKPSTPAENRAEWAAPRPRLGTPRRGRRGTSGRSVAIRAGLLPGEGPEAISAQGLQATDRDQLPRW